MSAAKSTAKMEQQYKCLTERVAKCWHGDHYITVGGGGIPKIRSTLTSIGCGNYCLMKQDTVHTFCLSIQT